MTNRCTFSETSRGGLYVMVFFILLNTCGLQQSIEEIQDRLPEQSENAP